MSKKTAEDFEFGECIGLGSYSKVYKGVSVQSRKVFAIKVVSKNQILKENKIKYVNIEKNTLNKLGHHPGIVTLYYTFQDMDSLFFVIDYANNGELLSLISRLGSFSEVLAGYYMTQLIDAVEFIHSKGVVHRDLKPENVLLNNEYKLMVTDFGAARVFDDETENNINASYQGGSSPSGSFPGSRQGSFVGTAEYVSPELLKFNHVGFECDLWALGCILYQLIVGRPPFKGKTDYLTFEKIIALDYSFPSYFIPHTIKDLISKLLVLDPKDRFMIGDIKSHEWFEKVQWDNKKSIWKRPTPKLEPYNPRIYSIRSTTSQMRLKQQQEQKLLQTESMIRSASTSLFPHSTQISQTSQKSLNKVLSQKIAEKNNELSLKHQTTLNALYGSPIRAPLKTASKVEPKPLRKVPSNSSSPTMEWNFQNSPPITRHNGDSGVRYPASSSSPSTPTIQTNRSREGFAGSPSGWNKGPNVSTVKERRNSLQLADNSKQLQTPPSSRDRSKIAQSAIFKKSDIVRYPAQLRSSPVNPVLLDSNIPKDVKAKLGANESILKLDNVFKTELVYKRSEDIQLDDKTLNDIIEKNKTKICNEAKNCVMVITSLARILLFEVNCDFQLTTPQSSSMMQAFPFYKTFQEIKLTNKNVSIYDYDFDEQQCTGYLVSELSSINKLILIRMFEPDLFPGNAGVRVGFVTHNEKSWIESLLKAKDLIRSGNKRKQEPKKTANGNAVVGKKTATNIIQGSKSNIVQRKASPGNNSIAESMKSLNVRSKNSPNNSTSQLNMIIKQQSNKNKFAAAAAAASTKKSVMN